MDSNTTYYGPITLKTSDTTESKQLYIYQPWVQAIFISMYAVIFVFGVGGIITVLVVILCKKHMRTSINMYILNLSASDALVIRDQTIWEILKFCYRHQILGLIYRIRADAHGILVFTC